MRFCARLLIVPVVGTLFAACAGPDIEMLENMPAKGTAFDQALKAGYVELAREESEESDIADADRFAMKARMAAEGENVLPDRLFDRDVPEKYHEELDAGWRRLALARSSDAKERAPRQLAEAQTMFDCWLQEAEEDNSRVDISRCQIGFNAAMAEVDSAMKPATSAQTAAASAAKPAAPTKDSYVVHFGFNSTDLTPVSLRIIDRAVTSVGEGSKAIFVLGHTDKSGSDAYNRELADRRADAVIAALRAKGVKADISKVVVGERDPAVATSEGVREGQNRRVEIAVLK